MVGPLYTIPFAVCSLFAGNLALKGNRKNLLAGAVAFSASTLAISSLTDSFEAFLALRVLEGCFSAAISPLVFTLIDDYFPVSKRT